MLFTRHLDVCEACGAGAACSDCSGTGREVPDHGCISCGGTGEERPAHPDCIVGSCDYEARRRARPDQEDLS